MIPLLLRGLLNRKTTKKTTPVIFMGIDIVVLKCENYLMHGKKGSK
jgi:hypothetical protein